MFIELPYDRRLAVAYAQKWALSRNPLFYDFTGQGGNCTNFVSQCIFAGCGVMNETPIFGWYYRSADDRAPAWSGVEEFYRFMIGAPEFLSANGGVGPYALLAESPRQIEEGDVIQLADENNRFYHSLLITGLSDRDVLVSAQSNDALDRPLSEYSYASLRILHVAGVRWLWDPERRLQGLYEGTELPAPL